MIRVLPSNISNLIAAGEVVQRPASVVKELMENAVDAGSGQVSVVIKDSGRTLIQVIDDGCGMSAEEAVLCFERHATSKIASAEDLAAIMTFGFRGEALASIAAVAHVTLKTRREEDEVGTEVEFADSALVSRTEISCPKGSSFSIRDIFYNVPARRKFLKSDNVELKHIIEEFVRVSLTRPEIGFSLNHNGKDIHVLRPAKSLKFRIKDLLGANAVDKIVGIDTQTSVANISGFLGRPDLSTKTVGSQFFFVNGRFFRSPYFHKAVMKAYESLVAPGCVPSYFLFLECPPENVDVNISPTKTEVKFENEAVLFQVLYAAVHEALGRNSFGSAMDFDAASAPQMPVIGKSFEQFRGEIGAPTPSVDPFYDPFASLGTGTSPFKDGSDIPEEPLFNGFAPKDAAPDDSGRVSGSFEDFRQSRYAPHTEDCGKLFEGTVMPSTQVLTLGGKYIVTKTGSGLMLVNVARARERILYERFLKSIQAGEHTCQTALFPVRVEVGAENRLIFEEHSRLLASLGFDITSFGTDTIVVGGVPEGFSCDKPGVEALMADLLVVLEDCPQTLRGVMESAMAEKLAGIGAKRSEPLDSAVQAQRLLEQVFACENPEYTTKGLRIMSMLTMDEIAKKF